MGCRFSGCRKRAPDGCGKPSWADPDEHLWWIGALEMSELEDLDIALEVQKINDKQKEGILVSVEEAIIAEHYENTGKIATWIFEHQVQKNRVAAGLEVEVELEKPDIEFPTKEMPDQDDRVTPGDLHDLAGKVKSLTGCTTEYNFDALEENNFGEDFLSELQVDAGTGAGLALGSSDGSNCEPRCTVTPPGDCGTSGEGNQQRNCYCLRHPGAQGCKSRQPC